MKSEGRLCATMDTRELVPGAAGNRDHPQLAQNSYFATQISTNRPGGSGGFHEVHACEMHVCDVHTLEIHAHEVHAREMHPMRCTPVRCMPMRCTPMRCTFMRYTPMRCSL